MKCVAGDPVRHLRELLSYPLLPYKSLRVPYRNANWFTLVGVQGFPNGTKIGDPKRSVINSYAWLYEW